MGAPQSDYIVCVINFGMVALEREMRFRKIGQPFKVNYEDARQIKLITIWKTGDSFECHGDFKIALCGQVNKHKLNRRIEISGRGREINERVKTIV